MEKKMEGEGEEKEDNDRGRGSKGGRKRGQEKACFVSHSDCNIILFYPEKLLV